MVPGGIKNDSFITVKSRCIPPCSPLSQAPEYNIYSQLEKKKKNRVSKNCERYLLYLMCQVFIHAIALKIDFARPQDTGSVHIMSFLLSCPTRTYLCKRQHDTEPTESSASWLKEKKLTRESLCAMANPTRETRPVQGMRHETSNTPRQLESKPKKPRHTLYLCLLLAVLRGIFRLALGSALVAANELRVV